MTDFVEIVLSPPERGKKSALVIFLMVFAVYFALYRGPAEGYWDTYISVPAALMTGRTVDWRTEEGEPLAPQTPAGKLPDDLAGPGGMAASRDQPLGGAVLAAPLVCLLNLAGFRLFFALIPAVAALAFFSVVHRLSGKRLLAFVASGVLLLNPFILSFQRLNPNHTALLVVCVLLLLLHTETFRPALTGLFFGVMAAVCPPALAYGLLLLPWVFARARDAGPARPPAGRLVGLRSVLVFAGAAVLAYLPFFFWYERALGMAVLHPFAPLSGEGESRMFAHSFLGVEFSFNGLLNFPFVSEWYRTPHFPLPVFLLVPAAMLGSFGLLLCGLAVLGAGPLVAEHGRTGRYVVAWLVLTWLFWAFQENWHELKMSYLFLGLPCLVLLMCQGALRIASIGLLRPNLVRMAAFVVLAALLLKFAAYLDFPADERWGQRFPVAAAQEAGVGKWAGRTLPRKDDGEADKVEVPPLAADRRLDPLFFEWPETRSELVRERQRVCAICLLPCRYLPVTLDLSVWTGGFGRELRSESVTAYPVWETLFGMRGTERR